MTAQASSENIDERDAKDKRYPYYAFNGDDSVVHLEGRFWAPQGKQIAIVASVTRGIDWAAYIGTDAPYSYHEKDTLIWVSRFGAKLGERDARHFFPDIILPYRS